MTDWHCIRLDHGNKVGDVCRKRAKVRPICCYCSKTDHLSEDCPIKLAAEEGYGSEEAEISHSEGDEEASAEPEQSAAPAAARVGMMQWGQGFSAVYLALHIL